MKIIVYCPIKIFGGGKRLLLQLIPALARNPEVNLLTIITGDSTISKQAFDPENNLPLKIITINYSWWHSNERIRGIRGTGRIKSMIRRLLLSKSLKGNFLEWEEYYLLNLFKTKLIQNFDLIYCFWVHGHGCPELEVNKPLVGSYLDSIRLDFPEILGANQTQKEWLQSQSWIKQAAQIIVPSKNTKDRLKSHFNASENSISIVPITKLPWSVKNTERFTSEISNKFSSDYLIFPANINNHKNHYHLFIAWSRFARRNNLTLVLTGLGTELLKNTKPNWPDDWGQQATRLMGLLDRLGLKEGKDFYALGYVDDQDALALLQNAKALIMPTLAEGGGSYPVEEALTFGVPVLCSDIPVMREHLSTWPTKVVWFDPLSPDSIVNGLNEMLDNYSEYKKSAVDNMNTPRQSWDEIAANYVEVFKKAINNPKPLLK